MSAPRAAFAQQETRKVALYANVGPDLTHYEVDVAGATLTRRAIARVGSSQSAAT